MVFNRKAFIDFVKIEAEHECTIMWESIKVLKLWLYADCH